MPTCTPSPPLYPRAALPWNVRLVLIFGRTEDDVRAWEMAAVTTCLSVSTLMLPSAVVIGRGGTGLDVMANTHSLARDTRHAVSMWSGLDMSMFLSRGWWDAGFGFDSRLLTCSDCRPPMQHNRPLKRRNAETSTAAGRLAMMRGGDPAVILWVA